MSRDPLAGKITQQVLPVSHIAMGSARELSGTASSIEEVSFTALEHSTKYVLFLLVPLLCTTAACTPGKGKMSETFLTAAISREDMDLMCRVYAEACTGPKLAKRSLDMLLGLKGEASPCNRILCGTRIDA